MDTYKLIISLNIFWTGIIFMHAHQEPE